MNKIRVLQIGADNLGYGGRSVAVYNLTQHMESSDIENDFLYFGNKAPKDCVRNVEKKGGKIVDIGKLPEKKFFVYREYIRFGRMYKAIKKGKYNIVHVNADNAYEAMKSVIIARCAGVRHFVIHAHTTGTSRKMNLLLQLCINLCRIMLSKMQCVKVACSNEAAKYLFGDRYSNKDIVIINNAIFMKQYFYDETIRKKIRKLYDIEEKLVVGCVARFSYQKNHIFLLSIFQQLKKKKNNAVLLLVGDGPLRGKIEEKIEQLHIKDSVIILGNRLDVPELLQAMDVFLLPSLYEGLGIVNIEAQAAGLPCIVSDKVPKAACVSDLFKQIPLENSAEEWANTILRIIDNELPRKNMKAELLKSEYDVSVSAEHLCALYKNLGNCPTGLLI